MSDLPNGSGVPKPKAFLTNSWTTFGRPIVKRVAREKAVGCLRRKVNTGRPASESSCESVSKGERKEEKLMRTNIRVLNIWNSWNLKTFFT